MLIHLMQHGTCLPKELDPHQPLSPVGREQIEKSAKAAQILGLNFELMIASPKERSIQTAKIMAAQTGYPIPQIEITDAVKAMAPVETTIDFIMEYEGLDSIFIAGHLPSLGTIAATLLTGSNSLNIHIENGGLLQIDLQLPKNTAILNWTLSPAQLAQIANS